MLSVDDVNFLFILKRSFLTLVANTLFGILKELSSCHSQYTIALVSVDRSLNLVLTSSADTSHV